MAITYNITNGKRIGDYTALDNVASGNDTLLVHLADGTGEKRIPFNAIKKYIAGDLTTLKTQDKASLVSAVNELVKKISGTQEIIVNYPGAGSHNSIYRGKNLGSSVTSAQWAAIKAGTFDDLYIGDYWVINGITWRIAAFDYYLHTGDTECTAHHAVIVPDTDLYTAKMNATGTTAGGYVDSAMYKSNLAQAGTAIESAFGAAHILSHRNYLTNAVSNGAPSGGAWFDRKWDLMTERNVYGNSVFAPATNGTKDPGGAMHNYTVDKSQFPLFALRPDMQSTRHNWCWLRDIVSAAHFALVDSSGGAGYVDASNTGGVRLAFCIYQS